MANATTTIAGDVQLAGDLAGNNDATSPALTPTAVTPGSYTAANITVDSKGRITAASNGSVSLSGDLNGDFETNYLAPSGVVAGDYALASVTVDAKGRITSASSAALSGDVEGTASATELAATGVVAGSYSGATITVDAKGRITSAANGGASLSGDATGNTSNVVLSNTAVTPGTYSLANITVDAKGRITAASSGTLGGDLLGTPEANYLADTAVTPGTYSLANITVDAKGRITAASSATLNGDVSGPASATTLSATGVTAGTYTSATITVDAGGRVTSASSNGTPVDATYLSKGIIQIQENAGLTVAGGVLAGTLAQNGVLGVVKSADNSNITISSGSVNVGTNIPKLNAINTFSKAIRSQPSALTSGTTIAVNGSLSNIYTLTLSHNATLSNPTSYGPGNYKFIITQDGVGGRTLAFGDKFIFPSGHDKTIAAAANSISVVSCVSDGSNFYCTIAKNFV